jgi:hypothetical protein
MSAITVHNVTTGEIKIEEMTEEEVSKRVAESAAALAAETAREAAEAQKAADKSVLLEKLGITEDEARLLLG